MGQARVCTVGKPVIPNTEKLDAAESSVEKTLSDQNILASQYAAYSNAANVEKYAVLSATLSTIKQYVSGVCSLSYSQLQDQIKAWNNSNIKNDPASIAARDNLLQLLGNVSDDSLKVRALLALNALRYNTSDIGPAKAGAKPPVMLPDAGKPALPPVARPGQTVSVADWLSDKEVVGTKNIAAWNDSANYVRLYPVKKAVEGLRDFLNGKATEADLKGRMQLWEKSPFFNDSLSQTVLLNLALKLSSVDDAGLSKAVLGKAKKAEKLLPQIPEGKKASPPPPPAAEQAAPPKAAATTPALTKTEYGFDVSGGSAPFGNPTPFDRDTFINILTERARDAGNAFSKKIGSDFSIYAQPTFVFDKDGYLTQVYFRQVRSESGVVNDTQMHELLADIAVLWRGNIRYKANVTFPFGKEASHFSGQK